MNSPSFTPVPIDGLGERIHFEDFEISWAGENPLSGQLCFGSDDGRFRPFKKPGPDDPASPSGEAVNGIAFSSRAMAVSTRSDVGLIVFDDDGLGHRAVYDGGAHGVIATSSGGFVAPLGRNGLLTMKPIRGPKQLLATSQVDVDGNCTYFYELAHCTGDGQTDLVVGASRSDGLAIIELELNSLEDRINPGRAHFLRKPGLDVVNVCSIGSHEWPRAVVWLGIDRSIHLSRDILEDRPSTSLRINELRGKPYSILHDQGHLFLLTSDAVYVFPDLAARFLSGNRERGSLPVLSHYTKAYDDIYIAYNHLLLSMNGDIYRVPTASIVPGIDLHSWQSNAGWHPEIVEIPWEKSGELRWSSNSEVGTAA